MFYIVMRQSGAFILFELIPVFMPQNQYRSVADPGFPVGGGCAPIRGGVDLQHGHFLVKMYAKTKELGPIGGACDGHAPPRSANADSECNSVIKSTTFSDISK